MKHQYVGDINDYRKYALLRALAGGGRTRIGVCWMLTPDDGGDDGNKTAYLTQPEQYRRFDPELFDMLAQAASEPDRRRLQTIEESGVVPRAIYHNELLSDDLADRAAFMRRSVAALADADLLFFDPDNGLEVALPKGRKNSSKYLYLDEVGAFYGAGKSLLIYQHFPRVARTAFIASCVNRLRSAAPACAVWSFRTAHVVFLLLVHPESPAGLVVAAVEARSRLDPSFVSGEYLPNSTLPTV